VGSGFDALEQGPREPTLARGGRRPRRSGGARGHSKAKKEKEAKGKGISTVRAALVFCVAAFVTLAGGMVLERSGETIAGHVGMSGVLFGSTLLAGATALPVLFLMASLLSEEAVLPQAQATDIYLTGLGILLTAVYVSGLIFRSRRRVLCMGTDSTVVSILYALGVWWGWSRWP
jgi:cation:H+ antiporter